MGDHWNDQGIERPPLPDDLCDYVGYGRYVLAFVRIGFAQSQKFQFAVIGDTSYSKVAEQEFDRLMAVLNKETLAFVVHVGDFEADPTPLQTEPR